MAVTDLTGLANRKPSELSGGQQQRAALLGRRARPALLLLDEQDVDAGLRASLGRVLTRLRDEGVSVLVTHDQDSALAMSDASLCWE